MTSPVRFLTFLQVGESGLPLGPTLVVVPSSAMYQWADEIVRSTKKDTLQVIVYHGKRGYSVEDIAKCDVVITTYPILEYEYRKQVGPPRLPNCEFQRRYLSSASFE